MKTSEMIAMLEKNQKLELESEEYIFGCDPKNGCIIFRRKDGRPTSGINNIRIAASCDNVFQPDDWQLVREPVPVWEAFKALLSEGKRIQCDVELKDYVYTFHLSSENLTCISHKFDISWLKEGTWYIVE